MCIYVCEVTACIYVIILEDLQPRGTSVVVCPDPGKELHRQVGVGIVVIAWNFGGVMVSTLTQLQEMCVRFPL